MPKSIITILSIIITFGLIGPGVAVAGTDRLAGRILLQVEASGEAWYVLPDTGQRVYLGRPYDAYAVMREYALGVSEADFACLADNVPDRLLGRIILRPEAAGQAYYINPVSREMCYLGRPDDAFKIMRQQGLGISNKDLSRITVEPILSRSRAFPVVDRFQTQTRPVTPPPPAVPAADNLEEQVFALVNQYRQSQGKPALSWNDELAAIAREHSQAMAAGERPFSHNGFNDRLATVKAQMPLSWMSENVAYSFGYQDPAQEVLAGWINSPSHQAAMVNDFDLSGVGVAVSADGYYYFTQIFVRL